MSKRAHPAAFPLVELARDDRALEDFLMYLLVIQLRKAGLDLPTVLKKQAQGGNKMHFYMTKVEEQLQTIVQRIDISIAEDNKRR